MTILIDLDSTLTNFAEILLKWLKQDAHLLDTTTNLPFTYEDIVSYNWFEENFDNPWWPTELKSFWFEVRVNEDAVDKILKWREQGHQVFIVTASHFNNMLGYKILSTLSDFPEDTLDESDIIITRHKEIIKGDILIDDNMNNLHGFRGNRICYAQPWNKDYVGARTNDWDMIDKYIELFDNSFA